jgi:GT2 family glycosyltransferase
MIIEHIQVYDYDLNISKRLNEVIENLPNNWICLTDNDTLKFPSFSPNLKTILESENITKNDLIGTYVNRLRPSNPQVINELFDTSDINVHFNKAIELWSENKTNTIETNLIAGSCMIFHKELWSKIGGFNESKTFFDKYFSYDVKDIGGRCLIAQGLYIFHLYRWGSKSPVDAVEHLIVKNK